MTRLSRLFYFFSIIGLLFFGCLGVVKWTDAAIAQLHKDRATLVRGVIVKFKDAPVIQDERPHFERMRRYSAEQHQGLRIRQNERAERLITETGVAIHRHRDLGNGHQVMHFAKPMQRQKALTLLRELQRHPDVLYAEPDEMMRPLAVPNDADYAARQWYFQSSTTFAGASNMETAWNLTTGSASVVVAVLDTGIRPHVDLAGRYLAGYDFVTNVTDNGVSNANDGDGRDNNPADPGDWISYAESIAIGKFTATPTNPNPDYICPTANSSWHGTFVSGILGAASQNGAGIAGANWTSSILPVRIAGKCGAFVSDIIDGMRWAAGLAVSGVTTNPAATTAKVINFSFGGDGACSASYQTAINEVTAAGTLVVVAAGNDSGAVSKPANCVGVLAVGAARSDGLKALYSNFGSEISLMAPGGSSAQSYLGLTPTVAYPALPMWSLSNTGLTNPVADTYKTAIGTSFATPVAAGTASLMLSLNPALMPKDLISLMKSSARAHVNIASLYDVVDNVTRTLYSTGSTVSGTVITGTSNCTTTTCGAGLLDAGAAVAAAQNPAVNITAPTSAGYGVTAVLDGSASAAATGATVTSYAWTQTAGSAAVLQNASTAVASVVMPSTAGNVTLQLQVTDNLGRTASKSVTVTARAIAQPTAVATVSGTSSPGSTIGLNGSASYADTSFTLTSWSWSQLTGTPVSIQNPSSANASVMLPAAVGTFTFRLSVTDSGARTSFSDISLTSAAASKGGGGGGAASWLWGAGLWLLLVGQFLARFFFGRR